MTVTLQNCNNETEKDIRRITAEDFCEMFRCAAEELPEGFAQKLWNVDTAYQSASRFQLEEYLLDMLDRIEKPWTMRSREENMQAFEKGWSENLELLKTEGVSEQTLRPRYFRDNKFLRYNRDLIVARNSNIEYDLFVLARMIIFSRYLCDYDRICELGCGSCNNLYLLHKMLPDKKLCGFDWVPASAKIAEYLAEDLSADISGGVFDMLLPDANLNLDKNTAVITIHAMEQLGEGHGPFIDYLLQNKPGIVIHYEPIVELYDPLNLIDYLAIMYSRKRGYLSGYLPRLRQLENQNKLQILEQFRPNLGGVYHESSLIVWKPL
jgi:hypothetical protein